MKLIKIGLGRGVPAIGAIVFNLYVASKLPAKDADVFFMWFAVLYVLSFIGKLGFDTYILKELSVRKSSSTAQCKRMAFLASAVLSLGTLMFAPAVIYALLFALPFFSIASINSSVLRAEGRDAVGGFLEVSLLSSVALFIIVSLVFFHYEITIKVVALGFLCSALIVFLIGEIMVGKSRSVIGGDKCLSLQDVSSSIRFVPSPLMIYLTQWIAIFFLSTASEGTVSVYSVAIRLASGFAFIAITIDAFVAPRFARYFYDKDSESIKTLIDLVRKKYFIFLMLAFVIYALFGRFFIESFVGVEYVGSFYISLVISLSYCFILFVGPYQYFLLMGGGESKVNLSNGVSLVAVILGSSTLWAIGVESAWAYACVVAAARLLGIFMMRHFSLKIMPERKCV